MNEDFIPFELSKKLKEKGFDKPCVAYYVSTCSKLYFNITQLRGCTVEDCFISRNTQHGGNGVTLTDAPTISQVLKWLRKDKLIHIEVSLDRIGWYSEIVQYKYYEEGNGYNCKLIPTFVIYDSYEDAALAGIKYVVDNML